MTIAEFVDFLESAKHVSAVQRAEANVEFVLSAMGIEKSRTRTNR